MDSEHHPADDENRHEAAHSEQPKEERKREESPGDESPPRVEREEIERRAGEAASDQSVESPAAQDEFDQPEETGVNVRAASIESNQPVVADGRDTQDETASEEELPSFDAPPSVPLFDQPLEATTTEIVAPTSTDEDISTFDTGVDVSDDMDNVQNRQADEEPTSSSAASEFSMGDAGISQFDAAAVDPGFSRGGSDDSQIDPGFYVGGFADSQIDPGFYLGGAPDVPHRTDAKHARDLLIRSAQVLQRQSDSEGGPTNAGVADSGVDLSPRSQALLDATSDGGPPLARPIVLFQLSDEQAQKLTEEALAASAARDAKTVDEVAEAKVDHAFWVRACQERAVWR